MNNLQKAFDGNEYATDVIAQMWGISPQEVRRRLEKDQVPAYIEKSVEKNFIEPPEKTQNASIFYDQQEEPINKSLLLTLGALFGVGMVGTALWRFIRNLSENEQSQQSRPAEDVSGESKNVRSEYAGARRSPPAEKPRNKGKKFKGNPETAEADLHEIRRAPAPERRVNISPEDFSPSDELPGSFGQDLSPDVDAVTSGPPRTPGPSGPSSGSATVTELGRTRQNQMEYDPRTKEQL